MAGTFSFLCVSECFFLNWMKMAANLEQCMCVCGTQARCRYVYIQKRFQMVACLLDSIVFTLPLAACSKYMGDTYRLAIGDCKIPNGQNKQTNNNRPNHTFSALIASHYSLAAWRFFSFLPLLSFASSGREGERVDKCSFIRQIVLLLV